MEQAVGQLSELDFLTKLRRILSVAPCKYALLLACCLPSVAYTADYSSPYGQWQGQAQFHAKVGTELDPAAHAVVDMTITIDPKGKLTSLAASNGCRALGIVTPGVAKTVFHLDVTFSGCQYSSFNRRFSGMLGLYPSAMYASFTLQNILVKPAQKPLSYDVKATLKR